MRNDPTEDMARARRGEDVLAEVKPSSERGSGSTGTPSSTREALVRRIERLLHLRSDAPAPASSAGSAGRVDPGSGSTAVDDLPRVPPVGVPNHELLRCLGRGGFGQVWLARHVLTEHYRACKLISMSRSMELDGLRHLKQRIPGHANLFPLEEVGAAGDWLYCLMPLADNAASDVPRLDPSGYEPLTLDRYRQRYGRFATREAAGIGAQLAEALCHLHEHGVTHGDVKPANVLRLNGRWTLGDYGLVCDLSKPERKGQTPAYTPPEGPGGTAADQFALGVVLFELLTGWTSRMLADFREAPVERFKLDEDAPALRDIILRAVAEVPENRFGSMREMWRALQVLTPIRGGTGGEALGRRLSAFGRVRLWHWLLGAMLLLALTAGGVWLVRLLVDARGGRSGALSTLGTPPGAVRVESFDVYHWRYDGTNDVTLGRLGRDTVAARLDDDVTVRAGLDGPAYAYLLALDPSGEVKLCVPASDDVPPGREQTLVFPAQASAAYRLSGQAGTQGFVMLVSATALPSWRRWKAEHGEPVWASRDQGIDRTWVYDGVQLSSSHAAGEGVRGDVQPLRGKPKVLLEAIDWAKRQSGIESVYVVAFPVIGGVH